MAMPTWPMSSFTVTRSTPAIKDFEHEHWFISSGEHDVNPVHPIYSEMQIDKSTVVSPNPGEAIGLGANRFFFNPFRTVLIDPQDIHWGT
jgi:hypothetical protein